MRALKRANSLITRSEGQGLAEYGLIILFVAAVVYAAVQILGQNVQHPFTNMSNLLNG